MADTRSKNELFVAECFTLLSRFSNDKLKEFIDKEVSKKAQKTPEMSSWISFLQRLLCFGELEKSYCTAFLGTSHLSRFLSKREDNLKGQYASLLSDIRSVTSFIHKQQKQLNSTPTTPTSKFNTLTKMSKTTSSGFLQEDSDLNALIISVLSQLEHFIFARTNILHLYAQMSTEHSNQPLITQDLIRIITSTIEELNKQICNSLLKSLKETYVMECVCIQHLLTAQSYLQRPLYLESLLSLLSASNHLSAWSAILSSNKTKKGSFVNSASKAGKNLPHIFCWLNNLKNLLLSKFTFYFYEVLSSQGNSPSEMKNMLEKTCCDYYSKLIIFSKKIDAVSVMLVSKYVSPLDTNNRGYSFPENTLGELGAVNNAVKKSQPHASFQNKDSNDDLKDAVDGTNSFLKMIIFSHPHERPGDSYLKPLQQVFCNKQQEINSNKVNDYCVNNVTYVIMKVEGDIYLVSIVNKRLNKADNKIKSFYNAFCSDLRGFKQFNNIISGIK